MWKQIRWTVSLFVSFFVFVCLLLSLLNLYINSIIYMFLWFAIIIRFQVSTKQVSYYVLCNWVVMRVPLLLIGRISKGNGNRSITWWKNSQNRPGKLLCLEHSPLITTLVSIISDYTLIYHSKKKVIELWIVTLLLSLGTVYKGYGNKSENRLGKQPLFEYQIFIHMFLIYAVFFPHN